MNTRPAPTPLHAWLATYSLLLALTIITALAVGAIPGASTLARHLLRLTLTPRHNPPPTLGAAISIAENNTQLCIWPLLIGVLCATRRRLTLALVDIGVLAFLAGPALLVGSALGAYGPNTTRYLPHLPLEYAGIAIGAAGWLIDRRRPLTTRQRITALALTALALLCAAVIETTLVPHR